MTEQFKTRALRLAETLNLELSREDPHNVYGHRSNFVHGSRPNFEGLTPEPDDAGESTDMDSRLIGRYERCERVLRLALLRASTEPEFAGQFSTDDAIEKAFGSPTKKTPDENRAAAVAALSDKEFEAEYIRRYGPVLPFKASRNAESRPPDRID